MLTDEEKRTLLAEGYPIPSRLPLSKQEERNLKKIRRKIKNKISAQESRRKKKEYVETLEKKVELYSQENGELKRRVDGLENTNRSLLSQLRHLQQMISKSSNHATSTCSGGNNNSSSFTNCGNTSGNTSNKTFGNVSSHLSKHLNGSPRLSEAVGISNHSNSGGNGGGSASTCLMVFALCFAALFFGAPSPQTPGSAISPFWPVSYGSARQSASPELSSSLMSSSSLHSMTSNIGDSADSKKGMSSSQEQSGGAGFMLNQIGYSWCRKPNCQMTDRPYMRSHHPNSFATQDASSYFQNQESQTAATSVPLSDHMSSVSNSAISSRNLSCDLEFDPIAENSHSDWPEYNAASWQRTQCGATDTYQDISTTPRSRLLGSAKELKQDCVPRTLWSYLFGKPLSYAGLLEPELTTPNLNQPFRSQRASVLSIQVAPTPGHPLSDHRNSIRVDDDPPERREHLPRLSHTYSAPLAKPSPNPISPLHSSSHSSSSPSSTSSASFSSSSSPHSSFASSSTSSLFPAYTSYPSQYSVTLADLHEQIESLLMDGADLAQLHLSLSTSLVHANSIHTLSRSDPLLLAINHRIPDSRRTSIEVSVAMGSMRLNQSGPSIAASVAGQLPAVR